MALEPGWTLDTKSPEPIPNQAPSLTISAGATDGYEVGDRIRLSGFTNKELEGEWIYNGPGKPLDQYIPTRWERFSHWLRWSWLGQAWYYVKDLFIRTFLP